MNEDNQIFRFRSWSTFKYLFRGIEKFAPWVNNIFLITDNQKPDFLNIKNCKLKIVNHNVYIPNKYLPTFSSHVIELNLHRISQLSENFVFFNDDTFLLKDISPDVFFRDDMPCLEGILGCIFPSSKIGHIILNDLEIISKHFNKKDVINNNRALWYNGVYGELIERNKVLEYWNEFTGFKNSHLPVPVQKSTIQKLWNIEYDKLNETSLRKFRSEKDINQYLFRYWNLCEGNFVPYRYKGKYYAIENDNYEQLITDIRNQKYEMICINDVSDNFDFESCDKAICNAFESVFPDKSSFEL